MRMLKGPNPYFGRFLAESRVSIYPGYHGNQELSDFGENRASI